MTAVQSDFGGASERATALKQATTALGQSPTLTLDTQTTVSGNAKAQEVIQKVQTSSQKIVSAVNKASDNLKSVASAFEAKDQEVSQTFLQPLDLVK